MPIVIKNPECSETADTFIIGLPLNNHKPDDVDVTIFADYVKVSYPPHFFETFLVDKVDDLASTVRFEEEKVILTLKKTTAGQWSTKDDNNNGNGVFLSLSKTEMKQRRDEVLQKMTEALQQRIQSAAELKTERGRAQVRSQMQLEQEERERINSARELEKANAMVNLEEWKKADEQCLKSSPPPPKSTNTSNTSALSKSPNVSANGTTNGHKKVIFQEEVVCVEVDENDVPQNHVAVKTLKASPELPPVRSSGKKISVTFTPRSFPTPSRESMHVEEQEWLMKQQEARRISEIDEKDLTDAERDPFAMRKKADDFYRQENYLAAISAYTHTLRLTPKQPALYSNRAACHLKVGNYMKCLEDSSKALELLVPAVEANVEQRVLAIVRRGTALAALDLVVEALGEYASALKLLPKDHYSYAQIEQDAEALRKCVQSSTNTTLTDSSKEE